MNQHYDNHANDIEFFDIHVQKKKSNKKEFVDLSLINNDQIFDLHIETKIKLEDITGVYNQTQSPIVLEKLNRISRFRTAIRIAMKKRKIMSYSEYDFKLSSLKYKLVKDAAVHNEFKSLVKEQIGEEVYLQLIKRASNFVDGV